MAILKNGRNPYRASIFFSGNIVNIIHRSPLIKMVQLMQSSGGARGPILAHGLPVSIINQDVNKKFDEVEWRPYWISHDPYFRSFQNPFKSIQHPKNHILDILIIQIGQLVQNILTYRLFRVPSGGHFKNRFPELLPWSSMSTQVFFTPGVVP